jgi:cytosine/adenosine deaminase-related metal-dependent hydrolase
MTLEKWLVVIQREQEQLTDEQAYVGALATYAEALLSGTTTIVDMCIRPRSAARPRHPRGDRALCG